MAKYNSAKCAKSERIELLKADLFATSPQIEADRAVLLTESYQQTEGEPMVLRRAKAFRNILENMPVTIRPHELVVGAATVSPRSCQIYPEFSYSWLEDEFETVATRSADPFYISEENKEKLRKVFRYWKGRTSSELATSMIVPEARLAMEHNVFTPGNYFYNGVGHVTVQYDKVLAVGYRGIIREILAEKEKMNFGDADYCSKTALLDGMIERMEEELGQPVQVIATGGISRFVIPMCRRKMTYERDLLLKGLRLLYENNQRRKPRHFARRKPNGNRPTP